MYITYTHGSEDSLDHDTYVIFDHIPTFHEAKSYCDSIKEDNANILYIKDGKVQWSFKGTEDECNNSLIRTYPLHQQKFEMPDISIVERDYGLKTVRTIRGLLSYFSRTDIRKSIKKALRTPDFQIKLDALKECTLSYDIDYVKNSHVEVFKFFAFQIGQTLALIEDGKELFTKSEVALHYPELKPYLYREDDISVDALNIYLKRFILFIESNIIKTEDGLYELTYQDRKEIFSFVEKKKTYGDC